MDLATYIEPRGKATELAKRTGLSQPYICQMADGTRKISPRAAALIDAATGGLVSAETMLPELHWTRDAEGQVNGYHTPLQAVA